MDISSLTVYVLNSCDCDCDILKGGDGEYVKLDDIKELLKQTNNNARAKSAPDIVESNSPCDYCKIRGIGSCMECYISVNQHNFIGRRLSPVA